MSSQIFFFFTIILLILIVSNSFSLNKINSIRKTNNVNSNNNIIKRTRSEGVVLKDQNAFAFPLVVSIVTLVPFVIYQQALKPKARTVKQIELDEQLRPKDKKVNVGKAGQAKAEGSKKK